MNCDSNPTNTFPSESWKLFEEKNIWQISTLFPPYQVGGAEKSVSEISAELVKMKVKVTVFSLGKREEHSLQNSLEVYFVHRAFKYFPFLRTAKPFLLRRFLWHMRDLFSIKLFLLMYKKYRAKRPDLIISHNMTGLGYTAWVFARLFRVKLVHFIHDYNLICVRSSLFSKEQNCRGRCLTCLPRQLISRFAVSENFEVASVSKTALGRHQDRNLFIKNLTFIAPGTTNLTPKINRAPGYDFGFFGALTVSKGFDLFLQVAESSEFSFLVAGRGDKNLIQKIDNLKNVQYLGWMNPADFYSQIKYLIVPSRWNDPAPKVVYEAAASGVGLILASTPSLIELAEYYEITANYFESGNACELLETLKKVDLAKTPWAPPAKRSTQASLIIERLLGW